VSVQLDSLVYRWVDRCSIKQMTMRLSTQKERGWRTWAHLFDQLLPERGKLFEVVLGIQDLPVNIRVCGQSMAQLWNALLDLGLVIQQWGPPRIPSLTF